MEKNLKIIVESSVEKDNNALLNIIKQCLERDYLFRTYFMDAKVKLENKVIEEEKKSEETKQDEVKTEEPTKEEKKDE